MSNNKYDPKFVKPTVPLDRSIEVIDRDYPFRKPLSQAAAYNRLAAIEIIKQTLGVLIFTPTKDPNHRAVDPDVASRLTPDFRSEMLKQLHSNRHNFLALLDELCLEEAAHEILPGKPLTLPDDLLREQEAHSNGCCKRSNEAPATPFSPLQQLGEIGEGIVESAVDPSNEGGSGGH